MEPDDEVTAPSSTAAGWYRDPKMPGTVRFWDGDRWTENVAPMAPPPAPTPAPVAGVDTWKGIRIVAVGILAAAATIWVVYEVSQPSDLDCALERVEVTTGERPSYQLDEACR